MIAWVIGTAWTAVRAAPAMSLTACASRSASGSCHLQPAGVRLAAAGTDRASAGGSGPPYRLREQLLSGVAPGRTMPQPQASRRVAWGHAGITAEGDGRAQILLQAKDRQRQSTRSPCSALSSIGWITPACRFPARWRPANGRRLLWTGITTGTATAASNSSRPTRAIAVPPPQSARSSPCLRDGLSGPSKTLEPIHSMLAPTRRSVDEQANGGARSNPCANLNQGRLNNSQGVSPTLKVTAP